ncbi:MAG: tellurite resistance TerB family protein [Desulfobacteraceae bacterium]|nr:tellurite resistance TerB family protein [Desulfobacteraceae bacterium]
MHAAGLNLKEQAFITRELLMSQPIEKLIEAVKSSETAKHVYMSPVLAIDLDTQAGHFYLKKLSQELGLDSETINRIHRQLSVDSL